MKGKFVKLLTRWRNYSDANPIRFYCDNLSPDSTLRCTGELGHLGWCLSGDTLWRGEVWNVDHWANTEEAPPVESEPTMSATEWVRLKGEQHEPEPRDTPDDRDPPSAAWRRGYERDRNRAAAPTPPAGYLPARLRTMPAPDGIGTRILDTPMPPLLPVRKTLPPAGWLWWAAAAAIFLPSLIALQVSTNSPEERDVAAATPTPANAPVESSRSTRRFGEVKEKEPYSSAWGVGPYGQRYDSKTECENMIVISKRWVVGFDPNSVCRVEKGVTYGPTAPPWVIVP